MSQELSVITHAYDLLIWALGRIAKFDRSHRFTLGQRIETKLYDLLEVLTEAKFSRDKADLLQQAALSVEQIRILFRVGRDLQLVAYRSHEFATKQLAEFSREIGGWRKQAKR